MGNANICSWPAPCTMSLFSPPHSSCNYLLGVVYTMDHEVIPIPYKIRDWLLNSFWDYFGLHKKIKCQSDHGVRGPQKTYLKAYIIHSHGPTGFVMGEAKEVFW